ncbi:hypothetical protein MTO96_009852 [Rhipicephalus appendiculatus]
MVIGLNFSPPEFPVHFQRPADVVDIAIKMTPTAELRLVAEKRFPVLAPYSEDRRGQQGETGTQIAAEGDTWAGERPLGSRECPVSLRALCDLSPGMDDHILVVYQTNEWEPDALE